jgi:hypothetical protein
VKGQIQGKLGRVNTDGRGTVEQENEDGIHSSHIGIGGVLVSGMLARLLPANFRS